MDYLDNEVEDVGSHGNFTIVPNIIAKLHLSPFAFRLYFEFRMTTGDIGKCWMSTKTLAEHCNMSTGEVSKCKQDLVSVGLITIEHKTGSDGNIYHEIKLTDIWEDNHAYFHPAPLPATHLQPCSPHEQGGCSPHEQGCSPGEPIKTNDIKILKDTREKENKSCEITHEYREQNKQALLNGMAKGGGSDLSEYPEQVREVLTVFANLWKIKLPARLRNNSQKGYWIEGGRELLEACGELGTQVLRELRKDFEDYMNKHHGIAPFTVSTPKSLVNPARAKAGMMRCLADSKSQAQSVIPQGAAEVWIGGECYRP